MRGQSAVENLKAVISQKKVSVDMIDRWPVGARLIED
jgi:hypothetical protein